MGAYLAADKQGPIGSFRKRPAQSDSLDSRTPDVQTGDDSENSDGTSLAHPATLLEETLGGFA